MQEASSLLPPSNPSSIRLSYFKCRKGNLHQGEVLNFICIDPQCKQKGLVCSICQTVEHEGHQTIHLKTFLSHIQSSINEAANSSSQKGKGSSMTLNEQLINLERSKKEMEKTLQEMVRQVSEKVKAAEQKIHNSYLSLRKIILMQSTAGNKLPQIYKLLTAPSLDSEGEEKAIKQLTSLSEFIEYQGGEIHTIDKSHKLIEEYAKTATSVSIHLSTILPEISNKLESLPLKVKTLSGKGCAQHQNEVTYTFSATHKAESVELASGSSQAKIVSEFYGGLAFVEPSSKEFPVIQKISFKIKSCPSFSILLGIGDPETQKQTTYFLNEEESFVLTAISSVGFPLNDYDNPSFIFGEGDVIDVEWNTLEMKLSFSRRNGIQKCDLFPMLDGLLIEKQKFFVGMTAKGDCVEIVQSN